MTASTDTTATVSATTTATAKNRSLTARLAAVLLGLVTLLGVVVASPADAATGTTTVRICASKPSVYAATPLIASYWWNGSAWTQQSAVRGSCTTFTLGHSGYWYFRASTYVIAGCTEYVYGWTSNTVVKQQLPATTSVTVPLGYEYQLGIC